MEAGAAVAPRRTRSRRQAGSAGGLRRQVIRIEEEEEVAAAAEQDAAAEGGGTEAEIVCAARNAYRRFVALAHALALACSRHARVFVAPPLPLPKPESLDPCSFELDSPPAQPLESSSLAEPEASPLRQPRAQSRGGRPHPRSPAWRRRRRAKSRAPQQVAESDPLAKLETRSLGQHGARIWTAERVLEPTRLAQPEASAHSRVRDRRRLPQQRTPGQQRVERSLPRIR